MIKTKHPEIQNRRVPEDHKIIIYIQQLVTIHSRRQRNGAFYAKKVKMNIYALNKLTSKYLNRTITKLIEEYILAQAEYLLKFSTLSCKEITSDLNISDPPYFSRSFKRRTGLTPVQFREKYQALPDLSLKDQEKSP